VAAPLAAWQAAEAARTASLDPKSNPGAEVLMPWLGVGAQPGAQRLPASTQLDSEWVSFDGGCDGDYAPQSSVLADTCVQSGFEPDAPTMLAIGDSHMQQWLGTMLPVLEDAGWNVVALLKGGCSFAPGEDAGDECAQWRESARAYAEDRPAAVVMLLGTKAVVDSPDERVPHGLGPVVTSIADSGSQVLLVRDNPRFSFDMYGCLEAAADPASCSRPASRVLASENPASSLFDEDRVYTLDLTDYLCPDGRCAAEIGNVAVYLDDNHLTWTYARSMAPATLAALREMPSIPLG